MHAGLQGGEPTLMGVEFYQRLSRYAAKQPNPAGCSSLRDSDQRHPAGRSLVPLAGGEPRSGRPFFGWPTGDSRPLPADPAGKGTFDRDGGRQTLEAARRGVQHSHGGHRAFGPQRAEDRQLFSEKWVRLSAVHRMSRPVGREAPGGQPYSLTPERYAQFLKATFDAWYQDFQAGKPTYNRYFENLLMVLAGQTPESCSMQGHCAHHLVVEADGSVYPCDFYVLDKWKLGSICTDSLAQRWNSSAGLWAFSKHRCRCLPFCRACRWYPLCRNGCRRNRTKPPA